MLEQEHTLNAHEYTVDYDFADLGWFGWEVMLQKAGWLDMALGFGLGLRPHICCGVWDKVVLRQNFQAVGRHTTRTRKIQKMPFITGASVLWLRRICS